MQPQQTKALRQKRAAVPTNYSGTEKMIRYVSRRIPLDEIAGWYLLHQGGRAGRLTGTIPYGELVNRVLCNMYCT